MCLSGVALSLMPPCFRMSCSPYPGLFGIKTSAFLNHLDMRSPRILCQTYLTPSSLFQTKEDGSMGDGTPGSGRAGCWHGVNLRVRDSLSRTPHIHHHSHGRLSDIDNESKIQGAPLASGDPSPGSVPSVHGQC